MKPESCPLFRNAAKFIPIENFGENVLYSCSDCGVQFWWPFSKTPDAQFYETSKMYEFIVRRELAWYHRQFIENPPCAGGVLLDVGFGQGEFLDAASRLGFETWGIDIAERNVLMARKNYGLDRLHAGSLDDFSRTQEGKMFDVVTAFEVIEHIPDPAVFVASVAAIVKKGGIFSLSTPNLDRFGGAKEGWDFPPNHLFRWNAKVITRLLELNGFRVVRVVEQPFTRDFFFNRGLMSFDLMRRIRSHEILVKKGIGAVAIGGRASGVHAFAVAFFAALATFKNVVLRALLFPVEWILRLLGFKYWDIYIVAVRI